MRNRQFRPILRNLEERFLPSHLHHALAGHQPTRIPASAVLRSPPPALSWLPANTKFPLHLNNYIGDCTIAAIDNSIIVESAAAGHFAAPTDAETLAHYQRVTHYVPGHPETDRGEWPIAAELDWMSHPLAGVRSLGFAAVNFHNPTQVERSIFLYGSTIVTVALPESAVDQFQAGQTWTVTAGARAQPYSAGGHELALDGYDATGPFAVTWGRTVHITWTWLATYGTEAETALTSTWVTGLSAHAPNGLSQIQLLTNLRTLT